jgi:hypothetical protein
MRLTSHLKLSLPTLGFPGLLGWCSITRALEWKDCLRQPPTWYGSPEARRIADQVVEFQRESGGWPKTIHLRPRWSKRSGGAVAWLDRV